MQIRPDKFQKKDNQKKGISFYEIPFLLFATIPFAGDLPGGRGH